MTHWSYFVLRDALLFASTASILCLSVREFGLFNLAGGCILILGGWLAAWGLSGGDFAVVPLNSWWLCIVFAALLLQISSPLLLKETLKRAPTLYLFLTIGVALFIGTVWPTRLQTSYGQIAPVLQTPWNDAISIAACLVIVLVSVVAVQSRKWNQCAVDYRAVELGRRPWRTLTYWLVVEASLLAILGALTSQVHKGNFDSAAYRTIIALLSVLAVNARPWPAFLLCFAVSFASGGLLVALPKLSDIAVPLTIFVLGGWSIAKSRFSFRIADIPKGDRVLLRATGFNILQPISFYLPVILALLVTLAIAVARYRPFDWIHLSVLEIAPFAHAYFLVLVAWTAHSILGVTSICWPAVGTSLAYAWVFTWHTPALALFILPALFFMWVCYFILLRVLTYRARLVIDLSLATLLFTLVKRNRFISGSNEIQTFPGSDDLAACLPNPLLLLAGFSLCLLVTIVTFTYVPLLRAYALGMVNARITARHGLSFYSFLILGYSTLVLLATTAQLPLRAISPTISPDDLALSAGLAVFLFALLMDSIGGVFTLLCAVGAFLLIPVYFSHHGAMGVGAVGVGFMIIVFLSRHLRALNGRTA